MTQQRLIWVDSLKGWLMLLVIIGHAIQSMFVNDYADNRVWSLIYSFHMPAFMAVSGWLAYRPDSINGGGMALLLRRFRQLIIPYFVWSFIQYVRQGNYSVDYFMKMFLYPDAYFWFLWVLFFINVLFLLCQHLAYKWGLSEFKVVLTTCLLMIGLMVGFDIRLFGFQFIAYYYLFYTLGYVLRQFPVRQLGHPVVAVSFIVVWVGFAWEWGMHTLPSWMPIISGLPVSLLQYVYRGLTAAVAIVVILSMAPKVLNGNGRVNNIASRFGQVSLGIYVVHLTVMGYIIDVVHKIFSFVTISQLAVLVSALVAVLSWGIVELLGRNKHTAKILLGKV